MIERESFADKYVRFLKVQRMADLDDLLGVNDPDYQARELELDFFYDGIKYQYFQIRLNQLYNCRQIFGYPANTGRDNRRSCESCKAIQLPIK